MEKALWGNHQFGKVFNIINVFNNNFDQYLPIKKNIFIAQTVRISTSSAALLQIPLFYEAPGPNNSRGD